MQGSNSRSFFAVRRLFMLDFVELKVFVVNQFLRTIIFIVN
uniref:Uncharacterized protein n=1 Tax=Manihot esculenta TaxID=3983 RepID=A0A2C9U3Y0_MANES